MLKIVTLPEWERPMPEEYCSRGETYWSCVELPVRDNWVFVVNLDEDVDQKLSMRSLAVVSASDLISTIARLGQDCIRSVYLISQTVHGENDQLTLDRLLSIGLGVDPEVRWTKAIELRMASGKSHCSPSNDAVRRMTNRTELSIARGANAIHS